MELPAARKLARLTADDTNSTTFVYLDSTKTKLDYDVAFTVPPFGIQTGDPYLPIKKQREQQTEALLAPPDNTQISPSGHGMGSQSAHSSE